MSASIRVGTLQDRDGYRAVFEAVAAEGRWIATELPIDWTALEPRFTTWVTESQYLLLVAESENGDVIGWALSEHRPDGQASLGMGIVEGHRSAGLGTQLLGGIVDWARRRGAHKVVLEVWPHNTRAVGLYEKLGFVVEGRLRRNWRRRDGSLWDALTMGLVLDETSPGGPHP
jgi:RimJ/RimL family protein N-acetyltransferase